LELNKGDEVFTYEDGSGLITCVDTKWNLITVKFNKGYCKAFTLDGKILESDTKYVLYKGRYYEN